MTITLDETHDPRCGSWVPGADAAGNDFPVQNLPLGVFRRRDAGQGESFRIGMAIGSRVFDIGAASAAGVLGPLDASLRAALAAPVLNPLMALGREASRTVRRAAHALLRADSKIPRPAEASVVPRADVELGLPASIGDYSDFYASIHHATNVGSMFRPDQPLMPNYKWMPIGYHGRASSVVVGGTPIRRPTGQTRDDKAPGPVMGPSRNLDYELEVAAWVGTGNQLGVPVPIRRAEECLFGLSLLNDWSARDVQRWEYQPLGPFLAKSFATTVSPWVVTADALAPFRLPVMTRPPGDPAPLPYLLDAGDQAQGGFDITLEVWLQSARMRATGTEAVRLSRGSFASMYWTVAQLLAHHTSNGCNLRAGDLIGSGTVSGPEKENRGCLLELAWKGTEPVELPGGERRTFLEDGDEVIIRGWCARGGFVRIGFGECRGVITG